MADTSNLTKFLTDVSSAIKQKTGDDTPIPASEFDKKILNIETKGTYQEKTVTITKNGELDVTPDSDFDALSNVHINASVVDTSSMDATTATPDDVMFPQTFYSNGEKLIGQIKSNYEELSGGMRIKLLSKTFSNNEQKCKNIYICEEYGICLIDHYICQFKDGVIGNLLLEIPSSYYGSRTICSCSIAHSLNELGNLNIFLFSQAQNSDNTWDTSGAYITAVQYNPESNILVNYADYHIEDNCGSYGGWGTLAVNPIYTDYCAFANDYNNAFYLAMWVVRYVPTENKLQNVSQSGGIRGYNYRADGSSCEWDNTGTYLLYSKRT